MFRFLNKCEQCNRYKQNFDKHIFQATYCISIWRCKSYYHALGLDPAASAKDIKSAYYKMSLQYHPDKNSGCEESVAKFREITEAYEVLSNPQKKKKYDEDYSFQPQYSFRHRQSERYSRTRDRSASYQQYTGKTNEFDYDEHFRQHYPNREKQREAEQEYFRRRWEADFYRRYPTARDYYRNRHKDTDEVNFEEISKQMKSRRKRYFAVFSIWLLLILFSVLSDFNIPNQRFNRTTPLYYKVDNKNDRLEDEQNK